MNDGLLPALAGVRVLELGSSVAGPAAARMLGDLGADVLKIEPPVGDQLRAWGLAAPDGTSWWFKSHNRNKRLLRFDLHKEEDRAIVRRIALECDVLLENFRPGRMAQWGLGYDELSREKPGLIYASISGYGQDGPYAERTGFGNIGESMGGIRYITGFPDRPPVRTGIALGDELAALHAVMGIVAALYARQRDGKGDYIDVSLVESCAAILEGTLPEYGGAGKVREREGSWNPAIVPNNTYLTKDKKYFAIGANSDPIFRRFCKAIGRPDLAVNPKYIGHRERAEHGEELERIIAEWMTTIDAREANDLLAEAEVPAGPVYSVADMVQDPQVIAREAIVEIEDEAGVRVMGYNFVPRFRNHRGRMKGAAGAIGRDNAEVLEELGITEVAPKGSR